jgi:hypothetical protein
MVGYYRAPRVASTDPKGGRPKRAAKEETAQTRAPVRCRKKKHREHGVLSSL